MDRSTRVLFVDDDPMIRRAFSRGLGNSGFDIDLAEDAWQAIGLAEQNEYAVIALDYRMPGPDGLETSTALRRLQPDATLIMISGNCDLDLALDAVNEHDIAFVIPKPWNVEELHSILQRSLERAWERRGQREMAAAMVDSTRKLEAKEERLRRAIRRSREDLASTLLSSLELRDRDTQRACRRVSRYARVLGETLGLDDVTLVDIERGALLHDLGKIGIPDDILLKPAALTPEEWEVMRTHPEIGARLLDGLEGLESVRDIVLQHHERWDGSGYPRGYSGDSIVLGSRILAVVDTLDAIRSDRPYRKGASYEVARAEIARCSGSQFDPQVVTAFLSVAAEIWEEIRRSDAADAAAVRKPEVVTAAAVAVPLAS